VVEFQFVCAVYEDILDVVEDHPLLIAELNAVTID